MKFSSHLLICWIKECFCGSLVHRSVSIYRKRSCSASIWSNSLLEWSLIWLKQNVCEHPSHLTEAFSFPHITWRFFIIDITIPSEIFGSNISDDEWQRKKKRYFYLNVLTRDTNESLLISHLCEKNSFNFIKNQISFTEILLKWIRNRNDTSLCLLDLYLLLS